MRYDRMRPVGDFYSPSLGVAWNPTGKVTLRAYWARGYSLPVLLSGATPAQVMTFQTGVETTYIPYLWLKTTFFWNQLSDIPDSDDNGNPILKKQLKQGVEVEGKTLPVFNTSLSAGYTFIDAKDRDTGAILKNVPSQIVKLGLHYDDVPHSFRGALLGRYVWMNADSFFNAKDKTFIWDLNLSKKVRQLSRHGRWSCSSTSITFSTAPQYSWDAFKNTRRWVEGGIKFNF